MSETNAYHVSDNAAEMYQANMVRYMFMPWGERMLSLAAVQPGEHVLDVACGTGVVTRLAAIAAGRSGAVTGADVNPAMLAVAGALEPVDGAPITWIEADAGDMPVADESFDVALCQQGIQFFGDPGAGLREMRRALRPRGRVVVTVWRPLHFQPGHAAVAEMVEEFVGPKAGASRRAPYSFGGRETLRPLFESAGFGHVRIRIDTILLRFPSAEGMVQSMMAGTPLSAFMANAGPDTVASVIGGVEDRLRDFEVDDGLAVPMQCWAVTGQAAR